jgi:hypothetical protein
MACSEIQRGVSTHRWWKHEEVSRSQHSSDKYLHCGVFTSSSLYLVSASELVYSLPKQLFVPNLARSQDYPLYPSKGYLDYLDYLGTAFCKQIVVDTPVSSSPWSLESRMRVHRRVTTPWWWIKYIRDSRLPGVNFTGESIRNTDNSTYIQQNSKSFLGMYKEYRRICVMEKDGGKKSREGNVEGSYVHS